MTLSSTEKQSRRIAELDAIAQAAGWPTWTQYATAVKRGVVSIATNPAASRDNPLTRAGGKRGGRPRKETTMAEYNVFENEKKIDTVEAKSAKAAIKKVEKSHGSLFNPFAVNTQDANDSYGEEIDQSYGHSN